MNQDYPKHIKLLAGINILGTIITLLFWSMVFCKIESPLSITSAAEKLNAATIYGFGIADFIWSVPFMIFSTIGLLKRELWGWMLAQMTNALWWYAISVILIRDMYASRLSPGTLIFLPFTIFAFWSAAYLWKWRGEFK